MSTSSRPEQRHPRRSRPRCQVCSSRRWRKDPSSGLLVCEEGHVLSGYLEEETLDHEEGGHVVNTRKRYLRKGPAGGAGDGGGGGGGRGGRKKGRRRREGDVYYGARAQFLLYQCLQLLLRYQLQALKAEWPGLPPELEAITRDLWALRLSLLRLSPTPLQDPSSRLQGASGRMGGAESEGDGEGDDDDLASHSHTDDLQPFTTDEEDEDVESTLAKLAHPSGSESSYSSDSDDDDGGGHRSRSRSRSAPALRAERKESRAREREGRGEEKAHSKVAQLVCLLYLALVTLRVPVTWSDLLSLISQQKLPYLHAIHLLPAPLVKRLGPNELNALDLAHVPSVAFFHSIAFQLARKFGERFSITFPELNAAPVLWRCVQSMLLPPIVYVSAKSLLCLLDMPLDLLPVAQSPNAERRGHDLLVGEDEEEMESMLRRRARPRFVARFSRTPPEAVMMAAVLCVVKLCYGMDGDERYPTSESEGAANLPRYSQWVSALHSLQKESESDPKRLHEMNIDVLDMDDGAIDEYLSFCERTLLLPNHPLSYQHRHSQGVEAMLRTLGIEEPNDSPVPMPEHSTASSPCWKPLASAVERLYSPAPAQPRASDVQPGPVLEPGRSYSIYASDDPGGELDGGLERAVEVAAEAVCYKKEEMMALVAKMEGGLVKWVRERKAKTSQSHHGVRAQASA